LADRELWKAQKDVLPALLMLDPVHAQALCKLKQHFALPVEYQGEVGTPPGQREQSLS
jgi:hypothetical protein